MKLNKQNNKVAIIMGSQSDYPIMKDCEKILKILKVKFETKIVSAHRTPKRLYEFATSFDSKGFSVAVCGAGGAHHLSGMFASLAPTACVIGVPIKSKKSGMNGIEACLSVIQMPRGVPVGCVAIDGAFNAGLLAASIIGIVDPKVKSNLNKWKRLQTQSIKKKPK